MFNHFKILRDFSKMISNIESKSSKGMIQQTGLGAIAKLESKFKNYYKYPYALTFSSATNALTAISDCLRIRESEVITAPFNYYASIGGLMLFGNTAVFVDTHNDLTIDPAQAEKAITKKTKAVLAIDFAGNPHDTFGIRKLCDDYDLLYIADGSQSFGAQCIDIPSSSLADVLVVSLSSGKTLSAGEGACILIKDFKLYEKLLQFTHPLRINIELGLREQIEMIYLNGRINPFSAIMALHNFNHAIQGLNKFQNKYKKQTESLNKFDIISFPKINGASSFFYRFAFSKKKITDEKVQILLMELVKPLSIDFAIPFAPIYYLPVLKNKFKSQIRIRGCGKAEEYYHKMFMIN